MTIFSSLYEHLLRWASHRFAERYLAIVAFSESSFFPIPVEFMLAPMVFAKPQDYRRLALIASVCSVLGGLAGYAIGLYGFHLVEPWILKVGYMDEYQLITDLLTKWGFWIVFVAGFSPLPYKLFTIGAGSFGLSLFPFFVASIVGRSGRFFLVSWLLAKLGPTMQPMINRYIEWIGWACVLGMAILVWYYTNSSV